MLTRQLLAVVAVCSSLVFGLSPDAIGQDQGSQPTAGELYAEGMEQFEQGDLEAARASLRGVDHMQLPPNQRVRLFQTLQEIDRIAADEAEAAEADADAGEEVPAAPEPVGPTPAELLDEAGRLASEDPGAASQLYRQVVTHDQASDEQRDEAGANLAQLRRTMNRDVTLAREQIDLASRALDQGNPDEAIERLEMVQASDASLGWFDQQRVERQLAMARQQREAARPAEPEAPAEAAATEEDPDAVAAAEPEAPAEGGADVEEEGEADDEPAETAVTEAPAADDEPGMNDDLIARARSLRAQQRLIQARQAEEEGNLELAIRHYEAARDLDQTNGEVADRIAALRARQAQDLDPDDLIERQQLDRDIRRQQVQAEVREQLNIARERLADGNYTAARDAVTNARVSLDREQRILPPATYRDLRDSAETIAIRIDEQQAREEADREAAALAEERYQRYQERVRAERERREQIDDLLRRAMDMRMEMRYDRALELVDRALAIDPTNIAAQGMKMGIEDGQILVDYREQRRRRDVRAAELALQNMEATQPYTELVTYPHDWPELTVRRLAEMDEAMGESEANRQVQQALREPLPVDFEAHRLVNVIDYFQSTTGQNFFVNWRALESAGVDQDTPIDLQLANVPADQALRLVLQQASSDFEPVRYSLIDGIVHISTESDLQRTTDTRVYDVRDLLVQVPNFDNAPQFDLESALDEESGTGGEGGRGGGGGRGGRGGGGGGGLFGDSDDSDSEDVEYRSRAEMIAEIEEMIRTTVGRIDEWDEFGGDVSSIREYNGNLILRSTPDNHREVVELLTQLRETRAIQISVEARFLLVDQNFLENIGVDFDFRINNLGGNFGPISVAQDSIGIADRASTPLTPSNFQSAGGAGPGDFTPGQGFNPRTGRALDFGVSYLDDLEVNLLVHATQASQRSISLTAPRVTFFNGQRAYVIVARQFAFVSELEPIPDAVGFEQTLSVVNSGVVLDVEGTVSADRRYVTMTLQPSLATVAQIRQINQSAIFIPDGGGDGDGDGDGPAVPFQGTIEAPELELTSVAATVSIPDKGTLMLGGQRLVAETEVEAGVPVLSKIPFLNRLFTNTSMAKDERTLLILVKPS
ncbi:MAG: hypothetical protein WD534_09380, partial [Phycisphaeraceae bacterium]